MDEQTKRMVEEAEARASKAIGASWNIPDATYDDFRAHKADMASLCAKVRELDERIERAVARAFQSGMVDGAHHKQWCMDQMLRELLGDGYTERVKREYATAPDHDPWDTGIAP